MITDMAEEVPTPVPESTTKKERSIIWDFAPLTVYLLLAFAFMRLIGVHYS